MTTTLKRKGRRIGEHTRQGQVYHKEIQIVDHVQPDIINGI